MRRLLLCLLFTVGCADAYLDAKIDALGPEDPSFEPSEIHRPGAPCVLCHSNYGGAEPTMAIGGTLFYEPADGEPYPVAGYTVRVVDSEGQTLDMVSNRCGNFFVTRDDFTPVYPMRAELLAPDPATPDKLLSNRAMASRISRDGSCGSCHAHPASSFSPGVVFVVPPAGSPPAPPQGCPPPNYAAQPNTKDPG
ncbi:MAG: hypothetical protein KC731_22020 [Myxococcales bacterium]|nr:hypothetical protein [Myxococcales bacterium]